MSIKDKKDVSIIIESQIPEFVTQEHPKFKQFIERYYEFMESQQVYFTGFTFDEDKLVDESEAADYFSYEDDVRIQLESDRDTLANANLQFVIGETLTGNTSTATAVVTGTKGNTLAFIKPTNEATFKIDEKITGSTSRAYAVLANGISANVFPEGSIESFRSRGAIAATRDLENMQDIDKTNEGLIDDAWKKEFYTIIPTNTKTDRRQLLKQMKEVYQAKGNENSFTWLFRSLYAKEDVEFYYPKNDMSKMSDGKWTLDKSIKVATSAANNLSLFTGRKITGATSLATAIVETSTTSFVGNMEITELILSDVVQGVADGVLSYFVFDETITSETGADGLYAEAITTGILQTVTVDIGGTNYIVGDEIDVTGGGGQGARARVASILDSVVEGITVIDSGDGYAVGDPVIFINDGTGGSGAAGQVQTIISTGAILKNSDLISGFSTKVINASDYASTFIGHNANTHLFGNSSLIFSAAIKASSAKLYNSTGNYNATLHILAGDRIAKQVSVNTSSVTLTQSVKTVTLSSGLTEEEKLDVIGGKLTYANANTNIVTGFSSNTVLTVRDTHTIGAGQTFSVDYASNTYWGTVISANTTAFLYSVGSHYRDTDIDALTVQNFVNDDNIIIYNSQFTKLGAAAAGSGVDAHNMHNGVTFQVGNTPASVTTDTFTIVDAHGALPDVINVTLGSLNMDSVEVGAIDTFVLTSGGGGYETSPTISVANNYTPTLGNALDIVGAPNALLNVNLHSFTSGTIAQDGNVVTLTSEESFPDANSGVLIITYANGATDSVTAVTNSTVIRVSTEKIFGVGVGDFPDKETYSLSYMAQANNFTRNTLLYNDDYSARGRVLDFIDKGTLFGTNPYIASGNTTLRVDMTTVQDFGGVIEHILLEEKDFHNDRYSHKKLLLESDTVGSTQGGGGQFLIEACVEFLSQENGTTDSVPSDAILFEDESRIYTEVTTGDRITAYSNATSTYTTNTITQSGTTVTGIGTVFPNDFVRGTITYADDTTSTITGYTNATSFTVEDSKTIGSGQTYSISYNSALTWGTNRIITILAGGAGNRTVTVTESGHYLRTGDKLKISGSGTTLFNGVYSITVANNTTYTYTLPENTAVTSPSGALRAMPVASAWLATSNAVTMDTSLKGNNAIIEVSAIAIGAIQSVEVYNFGAGYTSAPTLSAAGGNRDAGFTAILGAYAEYGGYYTGTGGLLSGVPKIQDGKYYQDFSYVLKTDFDVNIFRNNVKRITHPSGMAMFGELAIRSKVSARMFDDGQSGNVNSFFPLVGPDARKYHTFEVTINSYANLQYQSANTQPELEIFTAGHPWQAMDAKLEVRGDNNLLEENYRDVTISRTNSTTFTVTETLHGLAENDVVQISGFPGGISTDYWDGKYTIQTTPTTNTYTINLYRGDPGVGITADPYYYIVLDSTNGSADAGDNILMEASEDNALLVAEASVEYLKVETVSFANVWLSNISNWDSPFNSSFLMEVATDPSSANDEKILLEPGGSFLYPTLQFPEAETGTTSIDMSFNSDLLLEDYTTGDLGMESSGYLLDEQSGSMGTGPVRYISLEEDTQGYGHQYESIPFLSTHVTFSLLDSMRQGFLTEDGLDNLVCEDADSDAGVQASRLITERFGITDGAFTPTYQYIDNFSTSITSPLFNKEIEFTLLDSIRGGFQTEDGLDFIAGEGEEVLSTKLISEQPPFEKTPVIIHDHLISPSGRLIMEDMQATLLAFEDSDVTIKSYILEEGKFAHKMIMTDVDMGETQFNLVDTTGWHLMIENGVEHLTHEDGSRALTEEGHVKWKSTFVKRNYNLFESTGYHILMEDGVEHLTYEDGTRLVINDIEVQISLAEKNIILSGALTWDANNHGRDIIANSDPDSKIVTSTFGLQPFRPHFTSQWLSTYTGMFVEDKFTKEDDTGVILLERPFGNRNYLMQEDYPAILEDIMNPLKDEGVDFTPSSFWTVLPAYQHTKVLERFTGKITFADEGTTGSGSDTLFTTELRVGDEFQTADENIITEDSGGGITLETNERIQHEDITISGVQNVGLSTEEWELVPSVDFRWLMNNEDSDEETHDTHPGVIGTYFSWNSGFYFVTGESNIDLRVSFQESGVDTGIIEREIPEWENNNMLWEDFSKQLITEPQAFIVGAIANDTSLTVTRKHLGGVNDSIYQM